MSSPARADLRGALYVPAASVSLGTAGADLLHVHGLALTQVEVDIQLSVAGTFKFTIPNTFDIERADFLTARGQPALNLLRLGTRVWIRMGYGDRSGQKLLMTGYITSVATSFAEGASPDLEVSGQDALYRLTLGTREHRFETKSVQDAVASVAKDNGFSLRFAGTPPKDVTLDSNMQSDLDFLRKLAENFSKQKEKWEFFARAEESVDLLHFRPRDVNGSEIGSLKWGADLLSFKPEANLGNQVSRVEVRGWDELAKKAILGEARAAGASGGTEKNGAQIQSAFLTREVVRSLRLPVKTKQEADERAEAELAKSLNDHLKGEGETFGFPELLPDTRIRLDGLGAKFSRPYYVTKTVHRYDSSGYRTRFSIEEPDS
jgi:phage protein D